MAMAATTPMTMPAIAPPDRELGEGLSLEGLVEFVAGFVAVVDSVAGGSAGDAAEVAAVLLECSWIGRACVRRLAPKGDPAERPRRAHEICHVRREQVGVKIVRHNGLSGSALCNLLGVGIWSRTTRTCKAENR